MLQGGLPRTAPRRLLRPDLSRALPAPQPLASWAGCWRLRTRPVSRRPGRARDSLPSWGRPALRLARQRLSRLTERWLARRPAAGVEAAARWPQGVPMPAIASAPARSPAAIPRLQPSGQVATADPVQPLAQWIVLRSASPSFAALAAAAQSPVGAAPSSVGGSVAGARLRQLAALSRPVETSPQALTAEATVAPASQAAKARFSGTFVRPVAELDLSATPTHAVAEVGFAAHARPTRPGLLLVHPRCCRDRVRRHAVRPADEALATSPTWLPRSDSPACSLTQPMMSMSMLHPPKTS